MEQLQKLIDEYVKWTQENRMAGKKIAVYLGLQVEQRCFMCISCCYITNKKSTDD